MLKEKKTSFWYNRGNLHIISILHLSIYSINSMYVSWFVSKSRGALWTLEFEEDYAQFSSQSEFHFFTLRVLFFVTQKASWIPINTQYSAWIKSIYSYSVLRTKYSQRNNSFAKNNNKLPPEEDEEEIVLVFLGDCCHWKRKFFIFFFVISYVSNAYCHVQFIARQGATIIFSVHVIKKIIRAKLKVKANILSTCRLHLYGRMTLMILW